MRFLPAKTHIHGGSIIMSRLTQQIATVSKSLIRISEQLTELATQLDKGESPAPVRKKSEKAEKTSS
jgi:hypothetical protein